MDCKDVQRNSCCIIHAISRNLSGSVNENHGKTSVLLQSKPTFKPGTSQIQVSIIMSSANLLVICFYHFDAVTYITVVLKYI
jgi:hypothetical protein